MSSKLKQLHFYPKNLNCNPSMGLLNIARNYFITPLNKYTNL